MIPLLSIQQATKHFAETVALDGASLALYPGEVHALMGENGAGKSTLIKILAGVLKADSITLEQENRAVHIGNSEDARRLGLRFIHQELNLVPQLSVAENLFLAQDYPQRLGGLVHWQVLHQKAQQALARLDIFHIPADLPLGRLGSGDKMLINIAAAFVEQEPKATIYVFDEPTAALNHAEAERLFKLINELRSQHCAILYVSHRLDEVLELADRISVMRDGRTVMSTGNNNLSADTIVSAMTGRTLASRQVDKAASHSAKPLLELANVSTDSLAALDLCVHEGEIVGLAGLAGAGQSDVLEAIFGLQRRQRGNIRWRGKALTAYGPSAAWAMGMAYVPRERRSQALMLQRSIRDNILLPHFASTSYLRIFRRNRLELNVVKQLSKRVGLKAQGHEQSSHQLSGGNQQKLVFARALAAQPKLLLLDEPSRGVDIAAKYDIYDLIEQHRQRGAAVIVASSDLAELIQLCDRIVILTHHQATSTVPTNGLSEQQLLALCYGHQVDGLEA